jgi:hypothetical protein
MALKPSFFTVWQSSSTVNELKHHRHTEWLMLPFSFKADRFLFSAPSAGIIDDAPRAAVPASMPLIAERRDCWDMKNER